MRSFISRVLALVARVLVISNLAIGASAAFAAGIADNLQGYWRFDGNSTDSSGQGRDLNAQNAAYGAGLLGQALSLQGNTSSYAVRPVDDNAFDFGSSDFAIQAWVNWNSLAGEQVLIEKLSGASGPGWTLTKLSNNSIGFHFNAGNTPTSSVLSLTTGIWHQLLVNRMGDLLDVYLDSTNIIHSNQAGLVTANINDPLLLGKRNANDGRDFSTNGSFDEVAIWSRALTGAELAALWNNGIGASLALPEPATFSLLSFGILMMLRKSKPVL